MAASMKFDSARAVQIIDELSDPRFGGADGEARVADYVGEHFATMGYQVERLAVSSSRPRPDWVRWLEYGFLITSAYVLILLDRIVASVIAAVLLLCAGLVFGDLVRSILGTGRRRPPYGAAPVVIASLPRSSPAPVKVIFQASLGGLRPSLFHIILKSKYHDLYWINAFLSACMMMAMLARFGMWYRPEREFNRLSHDVFLRYLIPPILAFNGIVILGALAWECYQLRSRERLGAPERRGLAVLLELARSWPRSESRPVEPIFVAAGGQQLDHAGSREIAHRYKWDDTSRPPWLILLLAPGAGESLWLAARDPSLPFVRGTEALARDAARSLWIPCQIVHNATPLIYWPLADWGPVTAIMGSDPRAYPDATTDPQALHHAAQLATEIALRWAKSRQRT
jgi:hypothetical protein